LKSCAPKFILDFKQIRFFTFDFVSIGLVRVAEEVGLNLLAPRKKITVILIGNHSAGKSSFINW
jgi:ribosome biogenesis GTPase A